MTSLPLFSSLHVFRGLTIPFPPHKRGDFPVSEAIGDRTISLPFYPTMPLEHVDIVTQALKDIVS